MIILSISWIKYKEENNFRLFKNLGMNVYEIEDLDKVDEKISELISEKFNTIVLSNKVAAFSGDIITKYQNNDKVNIIITPNRK